MFYDYISSSPISLNDLGTLSSLFSWICQCDDFVGLPGLFNFSLLSFSVVMQLLKSRFFKVLRNKELDCLMRDPHNIVSILQQHVQIF